MTRAAVFVTAAVALLVGGSTAAAETLVMPKRDALMNTQFVFWGVTTLANHTAANPTTYEIDFGDGSAPAVGNVTDRSYIAVTKIYTSPGTKTATLRVTRGTTIEEASVDIQVFDPAAQTAANLRTIKINMAIEDGLRYLWRDQAARTTNFPAGVMTNWGGNIGAVTGLVVLAFENHGYKLPNDNTQPTGLYEKYIVRRGINTIINRLEKSTLALGGTPNQTKDACQGAGIEPTPCIGLRVVDAQRGYSNAIAMLPIAGSGALDREVSEIAGTSSAGYVVGKTYREILQRMVNAQAWGQADSGTGRGGWIYNFQDAGFDGSAVGWDVLAFLDAAAAGGITIPDFVVDEFRFGFNNALNNDGSLDYRANGNPALRDSPNIARTGVSLQGLFFIGEVADETGTFANGSTFDARANAAVQYIAARWNTTAGFAGEYLGSCNSNVNRQNKGCAYAMFNVFKGLKLHGLQTLPGVGDWHADYQDWLVANQTFPTQITGGNWNGPTNGGVGSGGMQFSSSLQSGPMNSAIAELILSSVALVLPDADKFATVGLQPASATGIEGGTHTLTAKAESTAGGPVPGATVTFEILAGSPNAGLTATAITNPQGEATFVYTDTGGLGTDRIQASIGSLKSNVALMVWVPRDSDGDGFDDDSDNCVDVVNPDQTDTDGDAQGDACDPDDDNDGVPDDGDNCRLVANADQANNDGDAFGDVCDDDDDNDGVLDGTDNCPLTANSDQANNDGDAQGDVCDADDDNDGVPDAGDNCQFAMNADQANNDGDPFGDLCDPDDDNDSVPDGGDNCWFVANTDQTDTNGDGEGDACDADDDNDGVGDGTDNCPLVVNADQTDTDRDGLGDACDATPGLLTGRMNGGGSVVTAAGTRASHGFTLYCNPQDGPQRLEVNWGRNRFHLESIDYAWCGEGAGAAPPAASFATHNGSGTGRYNGQSGAVATWSFSDQGEPGRNDAATITITVNGVVVLEVSGVISNGNHQAHQ